MKFLCIDPGTPFGFAVWVAEDDGPKLVSAGERLQAGCVTWMARSKTAAEQLRSIIREREPEKVFCELPIYMSGHAAAAGGSLVKLAFTVGRFMQVCDEERVSFVGVEVGDWMGQLSAKAVRHRAEGVLTKGVCDDLGEHALDAVCIGLHVMDIWPKG